MQNKRNPVIVLLIVITFILGILASQAGNYLVVDQEPVGADVILVFAGDKGERTEKAIELYEQGYADKMVLSGGPVYMQVTTAELMYEHALARGIPPEAIILEEQADSTYQNAQRCREIMEANHYQSALVVSSEYHMRRVRLTCEEVFKGSPAQLTYCAADDPNYEPARWWANNKSLLWTANEYLKLIGYGLGQGS